MMHGNVNIPEAPFFLGLEFCGALKRIGNRKGGGVGGSGERKRKKGGGVQQLS